MKSFLAMFAAALCYFLFTTAWAGAGMKKGEWRISTSMEMPGMGIVMPGGTFTHCMDADGVPYQESPDQECRMISRKVSGNTVVWRMRCTGSDGDMEMQGRATYEGDAMHATMKMITGEGTMTMRMQGQRLGPCR